MGLRVFLVVGKTPSRATTDLVDERDDRSCVRCGVSLEVAYGSRHHRQLRRHGDHSPANLVLLCGSGTTGDHGWVHSHPQAARDVGMIVPSWVAADRAPLYVARFRQWVLHDGVGNRTVITGDRAWALRMELGLL